MKRDAATERQVQAADPGQSTWLSANAGSGKTRVLTDRVARLLLDDVPPQRILCLTYTKAAASEMQNRLFRRLGEWAMLDAAELGKKLHDLGVEDRLDGETLRKARRLFARAIETPGGLKIQTIHSFCASLLRRFPLEAGVSPQFVEMDDRAARRLREEIVEELAERSQDAFDGIAKLFTGEALDDLTSEIAKHRAGFPKTVDPASIWQLFNLAPGYSEADLLGSVFLGGEGALFASLLPALRAGSANDIKAADRLAGVSLSPPTLAALPEFESVFLTGPNAKEPFSAKIGSVPTKATQAKIAGMMPELNDLMARVEGARENRLALSAAQKTLALHRFAAVFLPAYQQRKQRHGWLDFDDLILKARDLLTDPGVAEWVLYRLDGGIDHILVDEAQDTSPVQWQVIDLLAQEFTTGQGTRPDVRRTIFVVGDKKQSIYSFQGADPDGFDRMKDHFGARLKDVATPLQDLLLEYSFRSADAILTLVDNTFHEGARRGLGREVIHRAFKTDLPGRADLWPVIEKAEDVEKPHWADPVDTIAPGHHAVQLAARIAEQIKTMIARGDTLGDERDGKTLRRAVRPGDFLILVQRRSDLFHEIIRACKSAGLDIAGADRLKIGGELAVRDLAALLSFLATPEDSLSLATALRSPLFGWDEAAIYKLAAGRTEKYLWETLRNQSSAYTETHQRLSALRDDADFLRPYDLIERILTRFNGRRNLIARLGAEAQDGIDALLAQALAYERMEVPSLTGFLTWLETDDVEIKRQLDSASDQIRVMTVHGAKGLEAPIVILPDTGQRTIQIRDEIFTISDDIPAWKTPAADSPAILKQARDQLIARQEEERQRLLYVAMTRAEQWLIVCAAGDLGKGGSWYQQIADGMERSGAVDHDFGFGTGLRMETGSWDKGAADADGLVPDEHAALPDWAKQKAALPPRPEAPLAPSDLGGAKAIYADGGEQDEEAALRRGRQVHRLLEHLPAFEQATWPEMAALLLKDGEYALNGGALEPVLTEATHTLTHPEFADIFAPDALAEVDITATLPDLDDKRISGAIDRLIVSDTDILAVDFKSNAVVPPQPEDVPEGLLRQMGAYAAALAQIYPDHTIRTAILWTRTATLMPLPNSLITAALRRAATLDGAGPAT